MTHVLYNFMSFITDELADVFDDVHVGAFPTKTGYPLLGKEKGLFGDGKISHDKIIKSTKQLLYRFITLKDKSERLWILPMELRSIRCWNCKEEVVRKKC